MSNMLDSALDGTLDIKIIAETSKRIEKTGKKTITMRKIRKIRKSIYEGSTKENK